VAHLEQYRRKRRFRSTPEPAGAEGPAPGQRFVVQKHRARRLHYDFRLEIDGALKSWAVPKGPSLSPADKRLAIQTEDHPLEYADFEGVIPKGNYGAGPVMVWDRGNFDVEGDKPAPEQLSSGELKFQLHGHKLRGSFALVRMRRANEENAWLLVKHRDAAADPDWNIDRHDGSVLTGRSMDEIAGDLPAKRRADSSNPKAIDGARRAAMPERIRPMLATLIDQPFSDPAWVFEIKWDGERALGWVRDGRVEFRSRADRSITSEYPELQALARSLRARRAIVDGEIVVLDARGRSDFERLQQRMNVANPSAALLHKFPAVYYVFDLIWCDGYDLRGVPLTARKQLLHEILDSSGAIRYSDHQESLGEELFAAARKEGLEGIVGKRAASRYASGRSIDWIKVKSNEEIDAVVGGWTDPRAGRQYFGSLLLGLYDEKILRFIGHVGTGFASDTLERIHRALANLAAKRTPFAEVPETNESAHWVQPSLIARVRYGGWTSAGRLRHPVFIGLRSDINPRDCRIERPTPIEKIPEPRKQVVASPRTTAASNISLTSKSEREPAAAGRVERGYVELERELFRGDRETANFDLDGKNLRLTNLSKSLFPAGYTKRDLLAYYYRVAGRLMPFLHDRPLVLRRFPDGVMGKSFFQKEAGKAVPKWMETLRIASETRRREIDYFVASDLASLLYLVNLGSIDFNPFASRRDDIGHPDYLIFDLDPTEKADFAAVRKTAQVLTKILGEVGLAPFVKTSGARGIHVFIPLERIYTSEQVRTFAEIVARMLVAENRDLITFEHSVARRPPGRVYIDVFRNVRGQTVATAYSVRPVPQASVSMPLNTSDLSIDLQPASYTIRTALSHLDTNGDPWIDFWNSRQRLEQASERLEKLTGGLKNTRAFADKELHGT
jgi:bifunctional non-homologous end joining protein LigD